VSVRPLNIQDHFLNALRRDRQPVTVFLVKGVKLQGIVTGFDTFTVLLRRDGASQLVYKHSVSTIMPAEWPSAFDVPVPLQATDEAKAPLQDQFLATIARDKENVTLFLVNGVMLQGSVIAFDQFSLLLQRGQQVQMVYKHAISTLQPEHRVTLGVAQPVEAGEVA